MPEAVNGAAKVFITDAADGAKRVYVDGIARDAGQNIAANLSASNSAADNNTELQNAITTQASRGGGIVYLPAGTFSLTGNIELSPGVSIVGACPTVTTNSNAPLFSDVVSEGTWLDGPDDATACFIYNNTNDTVLGNSWVDTAYFAAGKRNDGTTSYADPCLTGVRIKGIGFTQWGYGVQIGAVNVIGASQCHFEDLRFIDINNWCIQLTNSWYCSVRRCVGSTVNGGYRHVAAVPVATVSPGQTDFGDLHFNLRAANYDAQGVVFESVKSGNYTGGAYTGTTAQLNQSYGEHCLVMAFSRTQVTSTSTMTNTSADIVLAAAKGASFPVGRPLIFTGGTLGATFNTTLVYGRVYFVVSQSTDTITVSDTKYGSAITVGAGGVNASLSTYGASHYQFTAPGTGGNTNVKIMGMEAEGAATTGFQFENITNLAADCAPLMTAAHASYTLRNVRQGHLFNRHVITSVPVTDHDSAALQGSFILGQNNDLNYNGGSNNYQMPGFRYYNTGGVWDQRFNAGAGLRGMASSGGSWLRPFTGMGQANKQRNTSVSPLTAFAGQVVFNGAASQTFTLPTITGDESTGHLGIPFNIVNASLNNLAVASDGTQTFNAVTGKFSLTISAQSTVSIQGAGASTAVPGDSSGYFWAVRYYMSAASLP